MAEDIKSNSLFQQVETRAQNLVTLEVATTVGPVNWTARRPEDLAKDGQGQPSKGMYTRIGLLDGDIMTQMDASFATGELGAIREFHLGQVRQGRAIIKDNIEAAQQLIQLAYDLVDPRDHRSSGEDG